MSFLDCRGWMCYNGGTLNTKKCQCSCPPLYTGASCFERKSVGLFDFTYSGKQMDNSWSSY